MITIRIRVGLCWPSGINHTCFPTSEKAAFAFSQAPGPAGACQAARRHSAKFQIMLACRRRAAHVSKEEDDVPNTQSRHGEPKPKKNGKAAADVRFGNVSNVNRRCHESSLESRVYDKSQVHTPLEHVVHIFPDLSLSAITQMLSRHQLVTTRNHSWQPTVRDKHIRVSL